MPFSRPADAGAAASRWRAWASGDRAIRAVALLEALKGVAVLAAGSGALALLHHDLAALATTLVEHAHLNPAAHYPSVFIDAARHVDDHRLLQLAAGAAAYGCLRLAEGWGLYFRRAWAELLAALSGAIYIPFEVRGLMAGDGWVAALLLAVNVCVVALMVSALRRRTG